jgi:proteasome assembly chaperone (PAC2) family protein
MDEFMSQTSFVKYYASLSESNLVAIVGSPGLRSIGKLVIDRLLQVFQPQLIAEVYSSHFPAVYQTTPSYVPDPTLPGVGGVKVSEGLPKQPTIQVFGSSSPPLILIKGIHANFAGQYDVAETVLEIFQTFKVKRIFILAGYGRDGKSLCCAATSQQLLDEMNTKYAIPVDYHGPFFSFSGLIFGLAKKQGFDAVSLFAKTKPLRNTPELPDEKAGNLLYKKLSQILSLPKVS